MKDSTVRRLVELVRIFNKAQKDKSTERTSPVEKTEDSTATGTK